MKRHTKPHGRTERALLTGLAALVAVLFVMSVGVGYIAIPWSDVVPDLLHGRETAETIVVAQLRLPRALLGLLVGFSLGVSGAAMQGLMRNPLAEPGIVGVSGAAALGAVIVFYFGLSGVFLLALPLGGIAGAAVATIMLFAIAGRGAGTMTLILSGVALNTFAGALTALALNLAPNPFAALEIVFWLLGSLADRSLAHVWLVLPPMLVGFALLISVGPALDALTLGEDVAQSLGFDLARLRLALIAGASLAVGSAVAVTGAIGFVGFVVPHLLRPLVGHRPSRLLLVSGLGGAALTLAADIAVRVLPIRPELKIGVVTAMIGAPFLLALVYRLRGEP